MKCVPRDYGRASLFPGALTLTREESGIPKGKHCALSHFQQWDKPPFGGTAIADWLFWQNGEAATAWLAWNDMKSVETCDIGIGGLYEWQLMCQVGCYGDGEGAVGCRMTLTWHTWRCCCCCWNLCCQKAARLSLAAFSVAVLLRLPDETCTGKTFTFYSFTPHIHHNSRILRIRYSSGTILLFITKRRSDVWVRNSLILKIVFKRQKFRT